MKDKSIGTGVALYVEQLFNPTILDHLCYCTENIETFFMKIHKDDVETCVGVVYRSPNSNHSEFLETYKTITAQLKSNKNIQILGDFNTNLFKHITQTPKTPLFYRRSLSHCFHTNSQKRKYNRFLHRTTYSFLMFKMSSVQELFLALANTIHPFSH